MASTYFLEIFLMGLIGNAISSMSGLNAFKEMPSGNMSVLILQLFEFTIPNSTHHSMISRWAPPMLEAYPSVSQLLPYYPKKITIKKINAYIL